MTRKNGNFAVLDLTLARIVNGADCWPPTFMRGGHDGAIAQLGERVVRNDEVGGSIPPGSTTLRLRLRVAQPRKPNAKRARRSPLGRRRAQRALRQAAHFPVNRGGRFSMKLATPSRKSLPRNATTISRLASMVASARVWNGTS